MTPVAPSLIGVTFALALAFMLVLDQIKLLVTSRSDPPAHAR